MHSVNWTGLVPHWFTPRHSTSASPIRSSGLILGGTNLEGLFHLKWQIAVYAIDREYITMNHGPSLFGCGEVSKRIDASAVETLCSIAHSHGQPSRSWLGPLARLGYTVGVGDPSSLHSRNSDGSSGAAFSLLAVRIYTGRRHQIRAHTRLVGRPTVADALYAPHDVMVAGAWVASSMPQGSRSLCCSRSSRDHRRVLSPELEESEFFRTGSTGWWLTSLTPARR